MMKVAAFLTGTIIAFALEIGWLRKRVALLEQSAAIERAHRRDYG